MLKLKYLAIFSSILSGFLQTSQAFAQTAANATAVNPSLSFLSYAPFVIVFILIYFMSIRPQMKKHKQQQQMLAEIKKGDEVATIGGILGTVQNIEEGYISLELAAGMVIKCQKYAIQSVLPKGTIKNI